jgi:hypothetical protein
LKRQLSKGQIVKRALDDLEEHIELLKVAYERYFNGVDKVPPRKRHDDVKREVRNMMRTHFTTTAQRFRMNSLRSRLITYEQYWTRILGQIEKGTFKRLLAESERRQRQIEFEARERARQAARAQARAAEEAEEAEAQAAPVNGARQRQRGPAKPPPLPRLPKGMDSREARKLYDAFVAAKRSVGESTEKVTYPALVRKLARELPKLQAKHGDRVRFEVATVDGKVKLRARARD